MVRGEIGLVTATLDLGLDKQSVEESVLNCPFVNHADSISF